MFRMRCKNFDDGYFKLNNYLFFNIGYDMVRGTVTSHSFHDELIFETASCGLNMHDINYTISKWKMLINLYLDPKELGLMCARLLHYRNGKGHKDYIPDIGMQFKKRRNVSGSCLMSMTVGFNPTDGWHCEVFSRASELTMRWYVDLIFVHVLLREIGKVVGFTVNNIKVYWHMVSTYQSITSMPWFVIMAGKEEWLCSNLELLNNPTLRTHDWELTKWQEATVKRFEKTYLKGDYQNFKVQRRPMEAYLMLKGEMERKDPVWTKDLTLPDIDINQEVDFASDPENDCFGKGGYR
ncbi:MAG: hypothetical protein HF312_17245 [Ignavibacteria bacterium]|jgi:hypothetical protein|nr:hypothetical protein [Ignavibacteria bacterium]